MEKREKYTIEEVKPYKFGSGGEIHIRGVDPMRSVLVTRAYDTPAVQELVSDANRADQLEIQLETSNTRADAYMKTANEEKQRADKLQTLADCLEIEKAAAIEHYNTLYALRGHKERKSMSEKIESYKAQGYTAGYEPEVGWLIMEPGVTMDELLPYFAGGEGYATEAEAWHYWEKSDACEGRR